MSNASKHERPLSPHLQIYKPQMTSILSITHRATGVALVFGLIMVAWMIISAAMGAQAYEYFMSFAQSTIGKIMLFGWTAALYYHLCNGVRHLFWDMGYLLKLKSAYASGYMMLIATLILTIGTWHLAMGDQDCLIMSFLKGTV